ncbi:MAG TPA: SpoIIE family protein phosphatase [Chthoniobacteraceae bacterium]
MVRVLVVDDEISTSRMLARSLQRLGFTVDTAGTAEEALDQLEAAAPHVMVLDFELPDMDGAELCVQLRGDPRPAISELPIVLLTAHSGEEEEVRCLEAGANDFVSKPISVAVLVARIQTQLRLRAMRTELQEQNAELEEWRRVREADLEAAQATQRAMIPTRPPVIGGWDVAAFYQPLIQVGGDAYGWESLDPEHWIFWIADATGHGSSAALLTALARLLFQHASEQSMSPAEILHQVNQNLFAVFGGRSFLTAACAVLEPNAGRITFAAAGHPPLLIGRAGGEVERLEAGGTLLGLGENFLITEAVADLHPGDTALLYTDGLISGVGADGHRMDIDDLVAIFRTGPRANTVLEATLRGLTAAVANGEFSDDLAAIALQRSPAPIR